MKKLLLLPVALLMCYHTSAQEWTRTYSTYFVGYLAENGFAIIEDGVAIARDSGSQSFMATSDAYKSMITDGYPNSFYSVLEQGEIIMNFQEKTNNPHIWLFPKPSTTQLQVKSQSQIDIIEIFNIAGKLIMDTPLNSNQAQLNIEHLSERVYLARITTKGDVQNLYLIISR